ncbi:MAG: hypothetical protein MAG458_01491 [Nitrosopumilus sp.]|nr:hypothetical protein [Nitrosopumilus sp.]
MEKAQSLTAKYLDNSAKNTADMTCLLALDAAVQKLVCGDLSDVSSRTSSLKEQAKLESKQIKQSIKNGETELHTTRHLNYDSRMIIDEINCML